MPNAHYPHLFAVVRLDDGPAGVALDENNVTVKKVMRTAEAADAEAARLNAENAEKGCRYFVQTTRFDDR